MSHEDPCLNEKLAEISRGIFINRCLLIFASLCAGIFLLAPRLAEIIAARCQAFWDACQPYIGTTLAVLASFTAVIVCTAYIVSKVSPPIQPPEPKTKP